MMASLRSFKLFLEFLEFLRNTPSPDLRKNLKIFRKVSIHQTPLLIIIIIILQRAHINCRDWTHGFVMINGFNIGRYASQINYFLSLILFSTKKIPYSGTTEDPIPPRVSPQSGNQRGHRVRHLRRSSGVK